MLVKEVADTAMLPPRLKIRVRREHLVSDSMNLLYSLPQPELLAPTMAVHYEGEKGVDAGGLTKDWFDALARALSKEAGVPVVRNDGSIVLAEVEEPLFAVSDDCTLVPRPSSNPIEVDATFAAARDGSEDDGTAWPALRRLQRFFATGRFFALAILRERPLPVSLGLAVRRLLLRKPLTEDAVREADPDFFRHRVETLLRPGGVVDLEAALCEPLTFVSAPTDLRPSPQELVCGGVDIAVTEQNKAEYVRLLCEERICGGVRRELRCFLQGFWDLLPPEVLKAQRVTASELAMFISGHSGLDVDEWRSHSHSFDSSEADEVIDWFWMVVERFGTEERRRLLNFTTGSSRLPPGGFSDLRPAFTVEVTSEGSPSRLPHAHTCVNRLVLQRYTSLCQLRTKLELAIVSERFEMY